MPYLGWVVSEPGLAHLHPGDVLVHFRKHGAQLTDILEDPPLPHHHLLRQHESGVIAGLRAVQQLG